MLILKKNKILGFLILVTFQIYAQDKKTYKLDINSNHETKVNTFYTNTERKKIDKTTIYYWTLKREIHSTQGGYSGRLLQGGYTEYFASNQLKLKGQLKLGVRVNEWNFWHENGILKKSINYKNGKIHGRVIQYNLLGKPILFENYKNGTKHGQFIKVINDTLSYSEKYKNGQLKVSKRELSKPSLKIKNATKEKKKRKKPIKETNKTKKKFALPKLNFKKNKTNEEIEN